MKRNGNRILTYAIAGSLALHLVLIFAARNVRPIEAKPAPTPPVMTVDIVPTPPPPTPTPKPAPPVKAPPKTAVAAIPRPRVPHTHNRPDAHSVPPEPRATSGPGTGLGPGTIANATSAPSAAPTGTPKPACANPNVPASAMNVMEAQTPDGADGASGTAKVEVTLAANGAVEATKIFESAGNMLLDRAALQAARASTYSAAIVNCVPTGGSYLFTVTFSP